MDAKRAILQVKDLRKVYRMGEEKVIALDRINLNIYPEEICCVFGASGSGKSTLLNMLAGMEKPSHGNIVIMGKDITKMTERELSVFRQKNIGFIFQSYNLMPGSTAAENVALPLMFQGMSKKRRMKIAKSLLHRVGLDNRANHYPSQMSGGQQQRVGIARAFVTRPKVVFADEPTGNLDTKTTDEVMKMITGFSRELHQTIIIVSHDPEMVKYATRTIRMIDGRIEEDTKVGPDES